MAEVNDPSTPHEAAKLSRNKTVEQRQKPPPGVWGGGGCKK